MAHRGVRTRGKREFFRSSRFSQERLGERQYRFVDERSGRSFLSPLGVSENVPWPDGRMQDDQGRCNSAYPSSLAVERRKRAASEFDYILRPLRSVFQASLDTGNPVQWH
jgi:hypothetical protein